MLSKCSLLSLLTVCTLLPYHFITIIHFLSDKRNKHTFDFLYVQHWKCNIKDDLDFDFEKLLTGSSGVTRFGCDISKLLNQRAEKFSRLQSVFAGPLPSTGVWCNV